jgi:hypothetical protein
VNSRVRSYFAASFAAAAVASHWLGCASSQIATGSEHPASPDAAQAPLPPVGQALSEPAEPATMATHSPDAHAHEGGGVPTATQADQEAERWTCPMHPEVVQSEPGKCPKCGMKLVPAPPKR